MNNIILEDGYNTDYMYSLVISFFYSLNDISKITIAQNADVYYLQEYIKNKFIYPIQRGNSIEQRTINKFRLYLFNCGWSNTNILENMPVEIFYKFLINNIFGYYLYTTHTKYDNICITDEYIYDNNVNLSIMLEKWFIKNTDKFEQLPYIIPIQIDCKVKIDVMEQIKLPEQINSQDTLWAISSLICKNEEGYYSIIINNDMLIAYSDKHIPSNWIIDLTDNNVKEDIMQTIKFVFYKMK